jgi:hypothetical protein
MRFYLAVGALFLTYFGSPNFALADRVGTIPDYCVGAVSEAYGVGRHCGLGTNQFPYRMSRRRTIIWTIEYFCNGSKFTAEIEDHGPSKRTCELFKRNE